MPPGVCDAVEKHIRAAHPDETGVVLASQYDDALAVAIITEARSTTRLQRRPCVVPAPHEEPRGSNAISVVKAEP
jgi:hypothetical protein